MKRQRIAVIGAGHLGRIHTRLLKTHEQAEIVGVVDPVSASRESAATEFGVATFADLAEVPRPLDGAIVATPTVHHFAVAKQLLAEGVHLFVEKPLTPTASEADELIAVARRHGLVLQVGHVERFNPAFRAVLPHVSTPKFITATRTSTFTFRSTDIGVVHDMMIHDLDLVLSLVPGEVVECQALGISVMGGHEDIVNARLTFSDGCVATLTASRVNPQMQRTMQIFSEWTYAAIDFGAGTAQLIQPDDRLLQREFDVESLSVDEKGHFRTHLFTELLRQETISPEKRNAIADEQAEFVAAMATGQRPTVCGEEARRTLHVAEQILSRVESHSWSGRFAGPRGPLAGPGATILKAPFGESAGRRKVG